MPAQNCWLFKAYEVSIDKAVQVPSLQAYLGMPSKSRYQGYPNYRMRPNYRTYPYKRTVKQFRSLQITASALFVYFFLKTYVMGAHLNCIDLSMQFKWVPIT